MQSPWFPTVEAVFCPFFLLRWSSTAKAFCKALPDSPFRTGLVHDLCRIKIRGAGPVFIKFLPKRQVRAIVAAILLAGVCGASTGYLLGRVHTRLAAEARLAAASTQLQAETETFVTESLSLLSILNSPKYSHCSDAELASFRELIYHSVSVRDAGHMHDGRMECSALFGREKLLNVVLQPTNTRADGIKVYIDPVPYASGKWRVFVLQLGDSFVVEDPNYNNQLVQRDVEQEVTMVDVVHHRRARASGLPSLVPEATTDRDSVGRVGDTLFATRCSARFAMCSTTFGSYSKALAGDHVENLLYSLLGASTAAFLTLALVFVRQHSRNMSQQLRRAIRKDRLSVVYQPIVDIHSGRIVEAEALARWTDEDGFAVSPDVFVKIAEQRGFVGELTALIVRRVVHDFGETLRSKRDFKLNINVTASDLTDARFLPMLNGSLADAGIAARSLAIEVTESSTASHQEARETIHELRRRGHSVQIDDFGTGYSSLAYLKNLSIDVIKIDKTFTQAIGTEAVTVDILPQILSMAEVLGLQVIVEGIETDRQAAYFAALDRPIRGQGWLFGRPVAAEKFHELFAESEKLAESFVEDF
jgi:sensor c-di-GMP phosphodiesterase-like protein